MPVNPVQLHEMWLERASIKEYLGNMPREQAEREAYAEIYGKEPMQPNLWGK